MFLRILSVVSLLLSLSAIPSFGARNIIIMIGDGMGPGIVGIAAYYTEQLPGGTPLNLERCGARASFSVLKNRSATLLVPDSASAATAIACGVRTTNGSVGVDTFGRPLENILEYAGRNGKRTGLVSTAEIVDATPAAFSAHVARRGEKAAIARQQLSRRINVLMGGGASYFDETQARAAGYRVLHSSADLFSVPIDGTPFLLGLFRPGGMPFDRDRGAGDPSLSAMTAAALRALSGGDRGFFLMVEGGGIDHAAHNRDTRNAIAETLAFDQAVGVALDFIDREPDTLLIVTADHDTGGPALTAKGFQRVYPDSAALGRFEGVSWLSGSHTSLPVPCWVIYPGNGRCSGGLVESTELFGVMKDACR